MVRQNSWAEEIEKEHCAEDTEEAREDRRRWGRGSKTGECWTDGLCAKVRKVEENTKKEKREKKKKAEAVKHWFGDDTSEDDTTESEDDDESEYTTIERKKRNKKKLKAAKEKKENKIVETVRKAKNMVGLGPITKKEIDDKTKIVKNYEDAKIEVVRDHLRNYYKYDENEIDLLKIAETRVSKETIYIAVENQDDIRDIYIYQKSRLSKG